MPRTRVRVAPYKPGSKSAKSLSRHLNLLRVKVSPTHSRFIGRSRDVIINWGLSYVPEHLQEALWINTPSSVAICSDKTRTLEHLVANGIPCPEFTVDRTTAERWLREGSTVFARTLTRANSARGLIELDPGVQDIIPQAPLYTKYINKTHEYRVHAFSNGVTSIIQKRRKLSVPDEEVNWRVRNHENGFIFAAELSYLPEGIEDLSLRTIRSIGLDFAALDVVYNESQGKLYVIEVNTAPGLTGRTLDLYSFNIKEILDGIHLLRRS